MSLTRWTPRPDYSSDADDLVADFYLPALGASVRYDRITGYFRSTVYLLIWRGLVEFVDRGGRIRILCSPELAVEDGDALVRGYRARDSETLSRLLAAELEQMLASRELKSPTQALASLVAAGVVDLRLATVKRVATPEAQRLFHDKVGLFTDASGAILGFRGSANETFFGMSIHGNVESIDAFPSWCGDRDAERAARAATRFERLWSGDEPGVTVSEVPDDLVDRLREAADGVDWREAVAEINDADLVAAARGGSDPPQGRALRDHQLTALERWEENGYRGILEHATGAGKTVTGVTAVGRHLQAGGSAIVVVPSALLLDQWATELEDELGPSGVIVHRCGAGNGAWKEFLRDWLTDQDQQRVVVAVTNTAASKPFLAQARHATGLLLVADEVHRLGAPANRQILTLDADGRLGLSATPERAGDPEGTEALMSYFGGVVHRYGLVEAVRDGFLTPYRYEVVPVRLTEDEQTDWAELSAKIRKQNAIAMSARGGTQHARDTLKRLLIRRSHIAKQAAGKVALARKLVSERYQDGQRWLVYCDDSTQLDAVTEELAAAGLPVTVFHSGMPGDKEATLTSFRVNGGVVVSIKCLDEGVDIPASTHALILASSRNPREFIQRRGRVLRRSEDKTMAHVFDAITLPDGDLDRDGEALLWAEVARAAEFASGAVNHEARHTLEEICLEFDVDLRDLHERLRVAAAGFEDDGEDEG